MKDSNLLSATDISVKFDLIEILNDINIKVREGQIISLLGANGAGKSTVLNAISGLVKPEKGVISYMGNDIKSLSSYEIVNLGLVQVPEERLLFTDMNVLENLELGAYSARARGKRKNTLNKVFKLFPILDKRKYQIAKTLSGGEQQMLAIGRSLMSLPKLLMLDEPSLGVAPKIIDILFETIVNIRDEGMTILLVEQNVYRSLEISDYAYILEDGRIVLENNSSELIENKYVKKAYMGM